MDKICLLCIFSTFQAYQSKQRVTPPPSRRTGSHLRELSTDSYLLLADCTEQLACSPYYLVIGKYFQK